MQDESMAMIVNLPRELDAQLTDLARTRATTKHALLIEAATRFVTEEARMPATGRGSSAHR
jgi:predicted transcriptional regulator